MELTKLLISNANNITNIIQIADIHIRTGNQTQCRFDEYLNVFENLVINLKTLECIKKNTAIIIICGDIFHNKSKVESHGIYLFNYLLKTLAEIAPVIIIQGNHDFVQSELEELDMLSACLHNPIKNVYYLEKTGLYIVGNIGFGLVSIKDVLQKGATSGQIEELPSFPDSTNFPDNIKTKIGLFHGTIINSKLDNYTCSTKGVPFEWFNDYDYILLGDIHLQSIYQNKKLIENYDNININNIMTFAYSGSLIQQNFGENPVNHGYLLWNLKDFLITSHKIYNPFRFIKIQLKNSEWVLTFKNNMSLNTFLTNDCPKYLKIRIIGHSTFNDIINLKSLLNIHNILNYEFNSQLLNYVDYIDNQNNQNIHNNTKMNIEDITEFNSKDTWIQFIKEKNTLKNININWEKWINNPELLKIDLKDKFSYFNNNIIEKIKKKNIEIDIAINKFKQTFDNIIIKNTIHLSYIKFAWLLCFNNNSYFNFDNLNSNIGLISAQNGYGKSSFLEVICLGLFGQSIPSRYNKSYSSSVISKQKPKEDISYTQIVFVIANIKYILCRTYDNQSYDKNKLIIKNVNLFVLNHDGSSKLIYSGTNAVNEWIKNNIGDINNFLLSCMITQNQDLDFFSIKSDDQIQLLDKCLKFDSINTLTNLFKIVSNSYKYILDHLDTVFNEENKNNKYLSNENVREIEELNKYILMNENIINTLENEYNNIFETWHDFSIHDIELNDVDIDANIQSLQIKIKEFDNIINDYSDSYYEELLVKKGYYENQLLDLKQYNNDNISITSDKILIILDNLEKNKPTKPIKSQEIINKNNKDYLIWKLNWDKFTEINDKYNIDVIKEDINLIDNNIKIFYKELQNIILPCNKPNKTLYDYNIWLELYNKKNKLNNNTYGSINELINICKNNPINKPTISKLILENNKEELFHEMSIYLTEEFSNIQLNSSDIINAKNNIEKENFEINTKFNNIENLITNLEILEQSLLNNLNNLERVIKPKLSLNDCIYKIDKIKKIKVTHDLISRYITLNNILESVTDSIKDVPYNPNCECCNKNPLRIQLNNVSKEITEIKNNLNNDDDIELLVKMFESNQNEINKENYYNELIKDWNNYNIFITKFDRINIELEKIRFDLRFNRNKYKLLTTKKENSISKLRKIEYIYNSYERWNNTKIFIQNQLDLWDIYDTYKDKHETLEEWLKLNNEKNEWENIIKDIQLYDTFIKNREFINNNIDKLQKEYKLKQDIYIQLTKFIKEQNEWNKINSENKIINDKWIEWNNWYDKYNKFKYLDLSNNYTLLQNEISSIKEIKILNDNLKYWNNIKSLKPQYNKKKELKILIKDKNNILVKYKQQLAVIQKEFSIYKEHFEKSKEISKIIEELNYKLNILNLLSNSFIDYRTWLYKYKVIPKIVSYTNILVKSVCNNNIIQLSGEINSNNTLSWFLKDGLNTITFDKASGFQKFLIGISIRISLSYIGASTVLCRQLFIDEGFSSCDNNHLQKIPDFIHSLLNLYDSILIVSHLNNIQESADISIPIERENSISSIKYGDYINLEIKKTRKKKILS